MNGVSRHQKKHQLGSGLVLRTITVQSGRTTMRLEPEFWDALEDVCRRERIGVTELLKRVEERARYDSRTSALRAYLVSYFRSRVP